MQWFTNLKVKLKLLFGFILLAMVAGIVGGFGYYSIHLIND